MLKPMHRKPREGWAEAIEAANKKHGVEPLDQAWLEADLLGDTEWKSGNGKPEVCPISNLVGST